MIPCPITTEMIRGITFLFIVDFPSAVERGDGSQSSSRSIYSAD